MNSKLTGDGGGDDLKKNALQFLAITVSFEHRHEDKSCSVWQEWVNERVRERERESKRARERFYVINVKYKEISRRVREEGGGKK